MGTFAERILGGKAGAVVTVEPDYIVINDGVSHAAVEEISVVAAPEKVLVIYDHDVPTGRPEAAAILRKNLQFADDFNCRYIQAEGIGYQYMARHLVKPGQIIIGGGSHGSIFGAVGAMGINVSIPELARVAETGRYSLVVPETVYVTVEGHDLPYRSIQQLSAEDILLAGGAGGIAEGRHLGFPQLPPLAGLEHPQPQGAQGGAF